MVVVTFVAINKSTDATRLITVQRLKRLSRPNPQYRQKDASMRSWKMCVKQSADAMRMTKGRDGRWDATHTLAFNPQSSTPDTTPFDETKEMVFALRTVVTPTPWNVVCPNTPLFTLRRVVVVYVVIVPELSRIVRPTGPCACCVG